MDYDHPHVVTLYSGWIINHAARRWCFAWPKVPLLLPERPCAGPSKGHLEQRHPKVQWFIISFSIFESCLGILLHCSPLVVVCHLSLHPSSLWWPGTSADSQKKTGLVWKKNGGTFHQIPCLIIIFPIFIYTWIVFLVKSSFSTGKCRFQPTFKCFSWDASRQHLHSLLQWSAVCEPVVTHPMERLQHQFYGDYMGLLWEQYGNMAQLRNNHQQ